MSPPTPPISSGGQNGTSSGSERRNPARMCCSSTLAANSPPPQQPGSETSPSPTGVIFIFHRDSFAALNSDKQAGKMSASFGVSISASRCSANHTGNSCALIKISQNMKYSLCCVSKKREQIFIYLFILTAMLIYSSFSILNIFPIT